MKRILLIYNPKAGRGQFLTSLPQVIDRFTKAGFLVEAYPTQAAGDAYRHILELEDDYEMIVPAGGDGTLDEVVTGLMRRGSSVPVGYIPMGSTNDYAKSLGLSANVNEAVTDILAGTPCRVDVGIFNEEHIFVYIAAFGAFTDVSYATNQDLKNIFGHAAYVMEAAKRLMDLKSYAVHVRASCFEAEADYLFGMITNSVSVGGIKHITGKEVLLDDGLFEVTLIRNPKNILEMQEIVTCLLTQNYESALIDYFKTDVLTLEAAQDIPWTFDGEYGNSWQNVRIENRKHALTLMLNREHAETSLL